MTAGQALGNRDEDRNKLELARRDYTVARACALESYLRESGLFTYSLKMEVIDLSLDPVEDFLVNRKEGHCEYFASALALLLRSIDIPARIVNGFKGGDWNDLTQTMNVRQKHAHSWVEAYAGVGPDNTPLWITLDPTPSAGREESIAHVGGIAGNFRPMTDLIRHIWVFYIVGYDGDRQNRLLYAPMRQMIGWVRQTYNRLVALRSGDSRSCSPSRTSAPSSVGAVASSRFSQDSSWSASATCPTGWADGFCGGFAGPVTTRPRSRLAFFSIDG